MTLGSANAPLIVIGGGPAGYAAALRARHRGLDVTLVEDRELGGVCLNRGCIPSKTMLHLAEVASEAAALASAGVLSTTPHLVYGETVRHRDGVVERLRGGLHALLRGAGVELVAGRGRLRDGVVHVSTADGERVIVPSHVILATGSSPARPPIAGAELPGVVDSDGALALAALPKRAMIVGAGAVGCEWAAVLSAFGVAVTLVEAADQILPSEDRAAAAVLSQTLSGRGVDVRTGVEIDGIEASRRKLAVTLGDAVDQVDLVLLATGRRANTAELGLDDHGVELGERGFVVTDNATATTAAGINAVGDVSGGPLLAHAGTHEAHVAIDRLVGIETHVCHQLVPSVIYTDPEVASVGFTLAQARQHDPSSEAHTVPFAAIGRAVATGRPQGFAQLVTSGPHGRLVGGQIVGPSAGDLIAEIALAVELEATVDDLAATVHAHPTYSEIVHETALLGLGLPLHVSRPSLRGTP